MENENKNSNHLMIASIVLSVVIGAFVWANGNLRLASNSGNKNESASIIGGADIELPAVWGNLGYQMMKAGVIDKPRLEELYKSRGGLSDSNIQLLGDVENGKLKANKENAEFLLNLFWALGLGNKNEILKKGPMSDPQYGGPDQFASTGGWPLAKGSVMDHYSMHSFITLTPEQQALVEKTSKNIYRPCCDNPTHFPDCNHGMAMLGLLELLASQNATEDQMYRTALQMNAFWFPSQYATIAKYLASKKQNADPKEILGINYSSASGYQKIESMVPDKQKQNGGSCGA